MSNNLCYGPPPEPDEEIEQHLTINSKGKVWFSGYNFGDGCLHYKKVKSKIFKIDKRVADMVMEAFTYFFSNDFENVLATDIGQWELELMNMEGQVYKYTGSLCAAFKFKRIDLSKLIRVALDMEDLFVFDGNINENEDD